MVWEVLECTMVVVCLWYVLYMVRVPMVCTVYGSDVSMVLSMVVCVYCIWWCVYGVLSCQARVCV